MLNDGETFFTTIGCMDGRCQEAVAEFGRKKFDAQYPDTITDAGLVGILANNPSEAFLSSLKNKITISLKKHYSRGILIDGHSECTGDPVDDTIQKDQIRKAIPLIQSLINASVPVIGVFVKRCHDDPSQWEVEEIAA